MSNKVSNDGKPLPPNTPFLFSKDAMTRDSSPIVIENGKIGVYAASEEWERIHRSLSDAPPQYIKPNQTVLIDGKQANMELETIQESIALNHGTLSILDNGHIVLGLPHDYRVALSDIELLQAQVSQWAKLGGVLVLNFPADVVDLRPSNTELK